MNKLKVAVVYSPVAFGTHRPAFTWGDLEGHASGLTGTDLVAISYARELAKRGHEVAMFCHNAPLECSYDGVSVRDFSFWKAQAKEISWDVAIAISNPNALADADPKTLRVVNRQVATFGIDCADYETRGFDAFVDLYTCPSETALRIVSAGMPHPEKFRVLPNGCYPEQFGAVEKVPGRVVYISSPDRGLHRLMQEWPEIRRRVPHAELRIYYQSLDSWLGHHCDPNKRIGSAIDQECTRRALYIRNALRRLAGHGVVKVGGVSHRQLARELSEAQVLAYPMDPLAFTETYCVAALEAMAAQCIPVISTADCMGEVHAPYCPHVEAPVRDRMAQFTDLVVAGLTDESFRRQWNEQSREHVARHAWPLLTERLETMLLEGIEAKRRPAEIRSLDRPRLDLVLTRYASGDEPIDVEHPFDSNSGGGCRAGFMGLVRALPKLGYRVRAFSTFRQGFKSHEDVDYMPLEDFKQGDKREALLAYYDTTPLVGVTGCLRIASHHTFQVPAPGAFEWTDVNLAPSQYAVDALRKVYDMCAPWYVMPNAVQPNLPEWRPVAGRCIYHTSPSRGLHHLLEAWPEIKRRVPEASLHVVGDVAGWLQHYAGKQDRQALRAERVSKAMEKLSPKSGVRFLGRLSRAEVLRELSEAACFPFPFDAIGPCETFSVSVMECLAIGVPVGLFPGDAMREIYCDDGDSCDDMVFRFWHGLSPSAIAEVVCTKLLSRDPNHVLLGNVVHERQKFGRSFTFEKTAKALDAAIRDNLPGARKPRANGAASRDVHADIAESLMR